MKRILLLLASAVMLFNCSNSEKFYPETSNVGFSSDSVVNLLPETITNLVTDSSLLVFHYENNRVNRIEWLDYKQNDYDANYYPRYDESGVLTGVFQDWYGNDSMTIDYSFDYSIPGRIVYTAVYATGFQTWNEIYVDENMRVLAHGQALTNLPEYTYDGRENIIFSYSYFQYGIEIQETSTYYSYDNNNNIFQNLNLPDWYVNTFLTNFYFQKATGGQNNITQIEEKHTNTMGYGEYHTFTNFSYSYNEFGYPIEITKNGGKKISISYRL